MKLKKLTDPTQYLHKVCSIFLLLLATPFLLVGFGLAFMFVGLYVCGAMILNIIEETWTNECD